MTGEDTARISHQERLLGRRLYLLLTRSLCTQDPIWTLGEALRGGVQLVQIREKPFEPDALPWCRELVRICAEHEVPVFINDRIDLVEPSGAFGVHLGQEDLDAFTPIDFRKRSFALGISTHDDAERARALEFGADCLGAGPCFATATKGYSEPNDRDWLRRSFAASAPPCYAIGGITAQNLPQLQDLGARAIAVSSVILQSDQPREVAEILRSELDAVDPS